MTANAPDAPYGASGEAPRKPIPPPHPSLRACVVVPARDEEDLVGSCLAALAGQEGISPEEYEVLLVLDRCADATEDRALEVADAHPGLRLRLLEGPGRGAGHARRVGMEEAHARFLCLDRPSGLIASTDADTVVAPDWLSLQLAASVRGARAIGGRIELREDADLLPRGVSGWRAEQGRRRHNELLIGAPSGSPGTTEMVEHWHFSGASLSLTAEAYAEIGGLEPRAALEDEYLERALERRGIPIERPLAVRVTTSARTVGRAKRGLARDLALTSWVRSNTYDIRDLDTRDLLERKRALCVSVSAILPMCGKERSTAALLDSLFPLADVGLLDETIVLHTGRKGDPGEEHDVLPTRAGTAHNKVVLHRDGDLMPGFGPVRGYGDALWRGLSVAGGDLVLFLDPSAPDPGGRRALGLLAPLLLREEISFVKGFCAEEPAASAHDDGRLAGAEGLSELLARPLINLYRPELAGFVDPLSPELAGRRPLLRSLRFPEGYGASISLLLDAADTAGVRALAQARLEGPRLETRIPLPNLAEAAYAVLTATTARVHGDGDLDEKAPGPLFLPSFGCSAGFAQRRVAVEERPPLDSFQTSALSDQQNRRGETRHRDRESPGTI